MPGSLDSVPNRGDFKGSRLGVPFPDSDEDERPAESSDAGGDEDQGADVDNDGDGSSSRKPRGGPWLPPARSAVVSTGAGWLLGLLFWGWVGLPLIQGGPSRVGKVLRAKFTNRAPGGGELP